MALGKSAKIWIIVLSIPVVLLLGCIVFVKMYFTSERLKGMVLPPMEQATNRDITVDDISVSIFPSIGVVLDKVTVSNPRGSTYDKPYTMTLDQLQLSVNLWELFHSTLKVNRIILEKPNIYLEVKEDGTSNYKTKKKPGEAAGETNVKVEGNGKLMLSNFEIHDGQILSVDKKYNGRFFVTGLRAGADGETKHGEKKLTLNVDADVAKFSYGTLESYMLADLPMTAKGVLSFLPEEGTLSIDSLSMHLKDLPLSMHGTVGGLYKDDMTMDLLITSPGATMNQVLSLVPPDMLKAAKGITSSGDIDLSMVVKGIMNDTISPGARGSFKIGNGKVQYSGLPKSITNINISGLFERPQAVIGAKGIGTFTIDEFRASLGTNDISGKLNVTNFSDPTISATINGTMNLAEVKEFYPLESGTETGGMLKANVNIDGKAKDPTKIKAAGSLEFHEVTVKSAGSPKPIEHLNGAITFNNQTIQSKQLAMQIGQSDLDLSFSLDNYLGLVVKDTGKTAGKATAKPSAKMTLASKQLRTVDLMSDKTNDPTAVKGKSNKDQTGVMPGFDMTANVTIGKLEMEKFQFTNVHGTLTSSNGIINLSNLMMDAYNGTIGTKGQLDLRDTAKRPFDFTLNIKGVESSGLLSNFTSFSKNISGKMTMTTHLKGDLNDTLGIIHPTLLGTGGTTISEGKLIGFPLTSKIADLTGIQAFRQVDFKDWNNSFTIENGRINIKDLVIHSSVSDFTVGGSQGLDGTMDYTLNVKIPDAYSSQLKLQGVGDQLLQFFKDKDGRVNLNLGVTGTRDNPSVKLDTRAQEEMAKKAVTDKANELLKGKTDDLKKNAGDLLKKFLKKP